MARRRNRFHNTTFWRVPCILLRLTSGTHSASVHFQQSCLYRFIQLFHRLFLHWFQALHAIYSSHGPRRERRIQPSALNIVQISPLPVGHALRRVLNSYTCSVLVHSGKRVCQPSNMQKTHRTCLPDPSSSSRKRNAFLFFRFTCRPHPSAHASSTAC
jgi:hypothetical protein